MPVTLSFDDVRDEIADDPEVEPVHVSFEDVKNELPKLGTSHRDLEIARQKPGTGMLGFRSNKTVDVDTPKKFPIGEMLKSSVNHYSQPDTANPTQSMDYAFDRIPGAGTVMSAGLAIEAGKAADRLIAADKSGNYTTDDVSKDVETVAQFIAQKPEGSFAQKVFDTVSAIPGFAFEIGTTGGVYTGAKKAVQKGVSGFLKKQAPEMIGKNIIGRSVGRVAGVGATAAVNPARTIDSIAERQAPSLDENGNAVLPPNESLLESVVKGIGDTMIEYGTERAGGRLAYIASPLASKATSPVMGAVGKMWSKLPGSTKVAAVQKAIAAKWLATNAGATVDDLYRRIAAEGGWDGVLGEMLEERAGDVARMATTIQSPGENVTGQIGLAAGNAVAGDPEAAKRYALRAMDQLGVEAVAFAIPGAAKLLVQAGAGIAHPDQPAAQPGQPQGQPDAAPQMPPAGPGPQVPPSDASTPGSGPQPQPGPQNGPQSPPQAPPPVADTPEPRAGKLDMNPAAIQQWVASNLVAMNNGQPFVDPQGNPMPGPAMLLAKLVQSGVEPSRAHFESLGLPGFGTTKNQRRRFAEEVAKIVTDAMNQQRAAQPGAAPAQQPTTPEPQANAPQQSGTVGTEQSGSSNSIPQPTEPQTPAPQPTAESNAPTQPQVDSGDPFGGMSDEDMAKLIAEDTRKRMEAEQSGFIPTETGSQPDQKPDSGASAERKPKKGLKKKAPEHPDVAAMGKSGRRVVAQLAEVADIPQDSGDYEDLVQFVKEHYEAGRTGKPQPATTMHPDDARKAYAAGQEDAARAEQTPPKPESKPEPRTEPPTPKATPEAEQTPGQQKLAEARAKLEKLKKKMQGKILSGIDAELLAETVDVTIAYAKAGVTLFAEFVKELKATYSPSDLRKAAKYFEHAWESVRNRFPAAKLDAATSIADSLGAEDEQTIQRPDVVGDSGRSGSEQPSGTGNDAESGDASGLPGHDGNDEQSAPDGDRGAVSGDGNGSIAPAVSEQGEAGPEVKPERPGEVGAVQGGSGRGSKPVVEPAAATNHHIEPGDTIIPGGDVSKLRANIRAIEIIKALDTENRHATPAEQKELVQYTGWGGLSNAFNDSYANYAEDRPPQYWPPAIANWVKEWKPSYDKLKELLTDKERHEAAQTTEFAHYTSRPVINSIWKIVQHLGFDGGTVLENAAGVGHFFGLMPKELQGKTDLVGVEKDIISGKILQALYPEGKMLVSDYADVKLPPNSVSLVVANWPFSAEQGTVKADSQRRYGKSINNLHNYFFARSLDEVKPGGLIVAISTHHTLDSNADTRKYLASRGAELVGAVRLPNNTFSKNAGTKVTTDILIIRKSDGGASAGQPWFNVREVGTEMIPDPNFKGSKKGGKKPELVPWPIVVNEYFADHPEMALGEHSLQGKMRGSGHEYTLQPTSQDNDIEAEISAALKHLPRDVFGAVTETTVDLTSLGESQLPDDTLVMHGDTPVLVVDGKHVSPGELHQDLDPDKNRNGNARKPAERRAIVDQLRSYISLRDHYEKHLQLQKSSEATDEQIDKSMAQLNDLYDSLRKSLDDRALNDPAGRKFSDESSYYRLSGLEKKVGTGEFKIAKGLKKQGTLEEVIKYVKSDVFTQRTAWPDVIPTKADTIEDAIRLSTSFRGRIDPQYIASLTGKSVDQVESQLEQSAEAYIDPVRGTWESASRYLSGNVRRKLQEAKAFAADNERYMRNVAALEKVQPEPMGIETIIGPVGDGLTLSSKWLPESTINGFVSDFLEQPDVAFRYVEAPELWVQDGDASSSQKLLQFTVKNDERSIDAVEMIYRSLNLRDVTVEKSETYLDKNGETQVRWVMDPGATSLAQQKAKELSNELVKWIRKDQQRIAEVENKWNDVANFWVKTDWQAEGEKLTLPGKSPVVSLRDNQRRAIAHYSAEPEGMIAHGVGAGKTFIAAGISMESRRLGTARKPMIVVHNITISQYATEFARMYPNARVFVATKKDLESKNRKRFLSRIAANDYDAVVIAQSQFNMLSMRPEFEEQMIFNEIQKLRDALSEVMDYEEKNSPTVKEINKMIRQYEGMIDKLKEKAKKNQDDAIYFDDLGVDMLIVDEAHTYKKPPFITKMGRIRGLQKSVSSVAMSMYMKARHIQSSRSDGRGVVMMTGTPVTNTVGEVWHIMNMSAPRVNEEFNTRMFDQFVSKFVAVKEVQDMNFGRDWKNYMSLAKFINGRQFNQYIASSWDVFNSTDLKIAMEKAGTPLPVLKGGKMETVNVPISPFVTEINRWLRNVYETYSGLEAKQRKEWSFVAAVGYGLGRAAALDARLVLPSLPREKGSKVEKCVEEVFKIWQETKDRKSTQAIFSDQRNPRKLDSLIAFCGAFGVPVNFSKSMLDAMRSNSGESDESDGEGVVEGEGKQNVLADDNKADFLYNDIKNSLIELGVPADEIALASDYTSDAARSQLFAKINSGAVRIVIGGTETLGTGANIQKKLYALHHLDTPWMPYQIQQRNGRAERFSNENSEIRILHYGMIDTLDAAIIFKTIRKSVQMDQALSGQAGNEFDDPASEVILGYEEQLDTLSGDPRKKEARLLQDAIRLIRSERESWSSSMAGSRRELQQKRHILEGFTKERGELRDEHAMVVPAAKTDPVTLSMTGKADVTGPDVTEQLDKMIKVAYDSKIKATKDGKIPALKIRLSFERPAANHALKFSINGITFDLYVGASAHVVQNDKGEPSVEWNESVLLVGSMKGREVYNGAAMTGQGIVGQVQALPKRYEHDLERSQQKINEYTKEINDLESFLGSTGEFPKAAELAEKEARLERLLREMDGTKAQGTVDSINQELKSEGIVLRPGESRGGKRKGFRRKPRPAGDETGPTIDTEMGDEGIMHAKSPNPQPPGPPPHVYGGRVAPFAVHPPATKTGTQMMAALKKDTTRTRPIVGVRSIVDWFNKQLATRVIVGKSQTSKRHPAHYAQKRHIIRARSGVNADWNFHEAGHAMEFLLASKLKGWVKKRSLIKALKQLSNPQYFPDTMASTRSAREGIAEFVRRYIKDYGTLPTQLVTDMENAIRAADKNVLLLLQDAHRAYQYQVARTPTQQLETMVNDKPKGSIGWGSLSDMIHRLLFNVVGPDVVVNRLFNKAMRGFTSNSDMSQVLDFTGIMGAIRSAVDPSYRRMLNAAARFEQRVKSRTGDIKAAFHSWVKTSDQVYAALGGSTQGREGVAVLATGKSLDAFSTTELLTLQTLFPDLTLPNDKSIRAKVALSKEMSKPNGSKARIERLKRLIRKLEIRHGDLVWLGNKSWSTIKHEVGKENWDAFQAYGLYRTALDRYAAEGHEYPGMDEFPPKTLRTWLKSIEASNPKFVDHYKEVNKFFDQLLLVAMLSGDVTVNDVANMKSRWPDYWALLRQTEDRMAGSGSSATDPSAGLAKAFGSQLPFRSLDEAVLMRTMRAFQAYNTSRFMRSILSFQDQYDKSSASFEVRKAIQQTLMPLRMDTAPAAHLTDEEQRQVIADYLNVQEAKAQGITLAQLKLTPQFKTADDINITMPSRPVWRKRNPRAINVVSMRVDGERRFFQIGDQFVYDMFASQSDPAPVLKWLETVVREWQAPKRRAITQNLGFAVVNAVRDTATTISTAEDWKGLIPGINFAAAIANKITGEVADASVQAELMSKALNHTNTDAHRNTVDKFFDMLGEGINTPGFMTQMSTFDRASKTPGIINSAIWKWMDLVNYFTGGKWTSETVETGSRAGAFVRHSNPKGKVLKALAAKTRGRVSHERRQMAFDLTTGFFARKSGNPTIASLINMTLFTRPMINILWGYGRLALQSADPRTRAFHTVGKMGYAAAIGAMIAAATYAIARAVIDDDDEFEKYLEQQRSLSEEDRMRYMHFGNGRIPFDNGPIGAMMSYGYNIALNKLHGSDFRRKDLAVEMLKNGSAVPGVEQLAPSDMVLAAELALNYSFFRDEKIVPQWMEDKYAAAPQFKTWADTPAAYQKLGEAIEASPIKIQYAARQLLGTQADNLIQFLDKNRSNDTFRGMPAIQELALRLTNLSRLAQPEPKGFRSEETKRVRSDEDAYQQIKTTLRELGRSGKPIPPELTARLGELNAAHELWMFVDAKLDQARNERKGGNASEAIRIEREVTDTARRFLKSRKQ